jgi:hypothetical protein
LLCCSFVKLPAYLPACLLCCTFLNSLPACLPACLLCCSFLNLLDRVPAMRQPPSYLLLENVVGFETSDMHALLLQCLTHAGYHIAEFILTPLQYGIPYSRPR